MSLQLVPSVGALVALPTIFFFFLNNNLQSSLQKNNNLKKGKEIVDYHDGFPLHVQQQGIIIPLRPMLYILEK